MRTMIFCLVVLFYSGLSAEAIPTPICAMDTPLEHPETLVLPNTPGYICSEGPDATLRPLYVGAQAVVERELIQGLQSKNLKDAIVIIHTPMPATPLCVRNHIVTEDLVDSNILDDPMRLRTVEMRSYLIRQFLEAGGRVYAVYPEGGKEQRSLAAQHIYGELCANYPQQLFDCPIQDLEDFPVGALYLYQTSEDTCYAVALEAQQANVTEDARWSLWWGDIHSDPIQKRLEELAFLSKVTVTY